MPRLTDWLTGKVMQIPHLYAGHRRWRGGKGGHTRARLQMHTRPVGISGLCCTHRNVHTRAHRQDCAEQSSLGD